jgi:hypothetical protein
MRYPFAPALPTLEESLLSQEVAASASASPMSLHAAKPDRFQTKSSMTLARFCGSDTLHSIQDVLDYTIAISDAQISIWIGNNFHLWGIPG